MNLTCNYTKKEIATVIKESKAKKPSKEDILNIIAKHASITLPKDQGGMLLAKYLKDGTIEVVFIKDQGFLS